MPTPHNKLIPTIKYGKSDICMTTKCGIIPNKLILTTSYGESDIYKVEA